jgi:hypothetical protein
MFDFRYHAVSLVAVLVALVVGVLLGVAIGDAGLVSSAEKSVRASLHADVNRARDERKAIQKQLDAERRYSAAAYPLLVSGRLSRQRIGLLFLGKPSEAITNDVRDALEGTGGQLSGTLAVRRPPDLEALANAAGPTRYSNLVAEPDLLEPFGRRMGQQLVLGGVLLRSEASALFSTRAGSLGPFDAVVVARSEPDLEGDDKKNADALESGMVRGLAGSTIAVVGVERSGSDPSQVGWYRDRDVTSIDDIDERYGQAALVFALGGATGSFGTGPQAEALLPGAESVGP